MYKVMKILPTQRKKRAIKKEKFIPKLCVVSSRQIMIHPGRSFVMRMNSDQKAISARNPSPLSGSDSVSSSSLLFQVDE